VREMLKADAKSPALAPPLWTCACCGGRLRPPAIRRDPDGTPICLSCDEEISRRQRTWPSPIRIEDYLVCADCHARLPLLDAGGTLLCADCIARRERSHSRPPVLRCRCGRELRHSAAGLCDRCARRLERDS